MGGIALVFVTSAAPLTAQANAQQVNWFFKGLHSGMCVEFLVAPAAVDRYFRGMVTPTPIESLSERYPALARVARDEEAYRGWVPAEYCWYLYRSVVVRGRSYQVQDGRQPVAIGYLAINATALPDSSEAVVVTLFTNSSKVSRAAEAARFRVDQIDLTIGLIPGLEDSPDERRFLAQHGRTTVQWDGHPGGPIPATPRTLRLAGKTMGDSHYPIRASFTPDSAFVAAGSLRVIGRGDIQDLMATSPIRLMTPIQQGGDADWTLGR